MLPQSRKEWIEYAKFHILNDAMSFSSFITLLYEPQTGILHYVSPGVNRWGRSPSHIRNIDDFLKIVTESDRRQVENYMANTQETSPYLEFDLILRDGSSRHIHAQKNALDIPAPTLLRINLVDTTVQAEQSELSALLLTDLVDISILRNIVRTVSKIEAMDTTLMDKDGNIIAQAAPLCPLCSLLRETNRGKALCELSDNNLRLASASEKGVSRHYCECAGLVDICAPIIVGGKPIAFWFVGQMRTEAISAKNIAALAQHIGAPSEKALNAFLEMPCHTPETIEAMAETLNTYASKLSEQAQSNYLLIKETERVVMARKAVERNHHQQALLSSVYEVLLNADNPMETLKECFIRLSRSYRLLSTYIFVDGDYACIYPEASAVLPPDPAAFCSPQSSSLLSQKNAAFHYALSFPENDSGFVGISAPTPINTEDEPILVLIMQAIVTYRMRWKISIQNEERRRELEYLATHDPLLPIYNRLSFEKELSLRLSKQESGHLLVFAIDNMNVIGGAYGHQYEQTLILGISSYLVDELSLKGMVYRFSEDVLAIITDNVISAKEIWDRLLKRFAKPWDLLGKSTYVTVSCALVPISGALQSVLHNITATLEYATDRRSNSFYEYTDSLRTNISEHLDLANELHRAVQEGCSEFEVYAQPVANITKKNWSYVEALLRWKHPRHGMIPPSDFIPIAEETTLIIPISMFMIKKAMEETQKLRLDGMPWLKLNINFSPRLAHKDGILDDLLQMLNETGFPPGHLTIEFTESMMIFDIEFITKLLRKFQDAGICAAIDNFGVGFSSLGTLPKLPLRSIKLDRGFVAELPICEYSRSILDFIVKISAPLSLEICCEGVSDDTLLRYAYNSGAEYAQGFLLSQPLPYSELSKKLLDPRSTAQLANMIRSSAEKQEA